MKNLIKFSILLTLCFAPVFSAAYSGSTAIIAANASAMAAMAANNDDNYSQSLGVGANAVVVCRYPMNDGCDIDANGCSNSQNKISWVDYAKHKLGYDVDLVSLSYDTRRDIMTIYVRGK